MHVIAANMKGVQSWKDVFFCCNYGMVPVTCTLPILLTDVKQTVKTLMLWSEHLHELARNIGQHPYPPFSFLLFTPFSWRLRHRNPRRNRSRHVQDQSWCLRGSWYLRLLRRLRNCFWVWRNDRHVFLVQVLDSVLHRRSRPLSWRPLYHQKVIYWTGLGHLVW